MRRASEIANVKVSFCEGAFEITDPISLVVGIALDDGAK